MNALSHILPYDIESVLAEVMIECERGRDGQPLDDRKTQRIGHREIFVSISVKNGPCGQPIVVADSHDRGLAAFDLFNQFKSEVIAATSHRKRVQLCQNVSRCDEIPVFSQEPRLNMTGSNVIFVSG